jgi:hypothetical protein
MPARLSAPLAAAQRVIQDALDEHDAAALEDGARDARRALAGGEQVPEPFFTFLLDAIFSPAGLQSAGTWNLLQLLQRVWSLLTLRQRARLLRRIERHYGAFRDWMVWFTLSEILGQQMSNVNALAVVRRLGSAVSADRPRAFLPRACELLVAESPDEEVARAAYAQLEAFLRDRAEIVRLEAGISVGRLKGVTREFRDDPLHAPLDWREPWRSLRVGDEVEADVVKHDRRANALILDVQGARAFLFTTEIAAQPGVSPPDDQMAALVGQRLAVRIVELNRWRGSLRLVQPGAPADRPV